jgi:hypothetical protein
MHRAAPTTENHMTPNVHTAGVGKLLSSHPFTVNCTPSSLPAHSFLDMPFCLCISVPLCFHHSLSWQRPCTLPQDMLRVPVLPGKAKVGIASFQSSQDSYWICHSLHTLWCCEEHCHRYVSCLHSFLNFCNIETGYVEWMRKNTQHSRMWKPCFYSDTKSMPFCTCSSPAPFSR